MRIEDTNVQQASRQHVEGHGRKEGHEAVRERHAVREGHGHHRQHDGEGDGVRRCKSPDKVAVSEEAKARLETSRHRAHEAEHGELEIPSGVGKAGFLSALIGRVLSGKDINITGLARACGSQAPAAPAAAAVDGAQAATAADAAQVSQADPASNTVATNSVSASLEQLNFNATGFIKTGDGKEVGFTLSLNLTKASVSGFSAEAASTQGPLSVNFAGSSSELFSMSFEFSINEVEEAGPGEGTGLLTVDNDDDDSGEAHEGAVPAQQADTIVSAFDFLKALRRAEFTSTYLSFSKTTIEASSTIAVAEGAPIEAYQIPAPTSGAPAPLSLVA